MCVCLTPFVGEMFYHYFLNLVEDFDGFSKDHDKFHIMNATGTVWK